MAEQKLGNWGEKTLHSYFLLTGVIAPENGVKKPYL